MTAAAPASKGLNEDMALHVALNHVTSYTYDKRIGMGSQIIRLRPAPHCRTPILSYSLTLSPKIHFIN